MGGLLMKCFMCDKKDFPIIYESHHDIKDQPFVICFDCALVVKYSLPIYAAEQQKVKIGKRCK
jgi:hypothetical protein